MWHVLADCIFNRQQDHGGRGTGPFQTGQRTPVAQKAHAGGYIIVPRNICYLNSQTIY